MLSCNSRWQCNVSTRLLQTLSLQSIMSQNGQAHLKILQSFRLCLLILEHNTLKGQNWINKLMKISLKHTLDIVWNESKIFERLLEIKSTIFWT